VGVDNYAGQVEQGFRRSVLSARQTIPPVVSFSVATRRARWEVGAVAVLSGLLAGCSTQAVAPPTTKSARSAPSTTSPRTTTSLLPAAACASFDPGPPYPPVSAQLAPLLLTLTDLPAGWASSPSGIVGLLGEFNSAAPSSLPSNGVSYYDTGDPDSYDEPVYFGQGVSETLGEAPSAQAAQMIMENLNSETNRCHPGTPLDLPGTEPNIIATVSLGATYSSAIAYATKGTYVVQLTWADALPQATAGATTLPPGTLPTGALAQLPPAAEMASIANAALADLPA
jgi:hypothetical protein